MKITEGQYSLGALTAFAAWLFIVLPLLYWPEVIHEYEPYPSHSEQTSSQPPNGSQQSPFFVQTLPGPDAAEKANRENEDRLEKKYADRWLVRWTMALFFATALLFCVSGALSYFAYQQIRLMRDEFLSTHRPTIRVKHLTLTSDIWGEDRIVVDLTCVNNGTTNAILLEIGIKYFIVKADRPIPIETHIDAIKSNQFSSEQFTYGALPCGRNWTVKGIDIERTLSHEENSAVRNRSSKLYCVGFVSYLDGAGRMRITGFCRVLTFPEEARLHTENCRFRKVRDPDYEYED